MKRLLKQILQTFQHQRGQIQAVALLFRDGFHGKRGHGAYGKTIVFGLLKRDGKVYTEIVPDCSKVTLQAVSADMSIRLR